MAVNNHWTGLVDWTTGLANFTTKMNSSAFKICLLASAVGVDMH